jgi:hypothetical protein
MNLQRTTLGLTALVAIAPLAAAQTASSLEVRTTRAGSELALGSEAPFHVTAHAIRDARLIELEASPARVVTWNEEINEHQTEPWYAISLDGEGFQRVKSTSYTMKLVHGDFEPLTNPPQFTDSVLPSGGEVYLVQFVTQPLQAYRDALADLGAVTYNYMSRHAYIVRMSPSVRDAVNALEFVRWVGPYHAEYRVEPYIRVGLETGTLEAQQRYVIQVFEDGLHQKQAVAARIEAMGGTIDALYPEFKLFQATMTPEQVTAVAAFDEVVWMDRWSAPEPDLNVVRNMSGANYLEGVAGFTGSGVRGEAFDSGVDTAHPDFQHNNGVLLHGGSSVGSHGTQVTGVVFGDGTGNANWRGLLPDAKIVSASYNFVGNRYNHTAELVDPGKAYKCVFQTNSWGSSTTTAYNSSSTEMDRLIFDHDILVFQSQSNTGNQTSRPQAWAKNVMSIGGINHGNTANKNNDFWGGASVGPAADGRIKPDLAHFYDSVTTPAVGGGYAGFGGTSCATPITAGYSGLFFEMWHNNVWNNGATGANVFWSRPHFSLAKAAMINTADQWTFAGAGANLHRYRQGWGSVDVAYMYDMRNKTFWVDQTDPLGNLESISYTVDVEPGEAQLRVTMVYPDPEGTSSSSLHRYNDLNLKVIPPTGPDIFWGNRGLKNNMQSVANGAANDVDTVENVFIASPAAGQWTVEVIGEDINTDGAPNVPGTNAVFSLWVSGGTSDCSSAPINYCTAGTSNAGCQATLSASGTASASATSGFSLTATGVEGLKDGLFFFGSNGRQANSWGSGTSFQCVVPPVIRAGLLSSTGTAGLCDGTFTQDLNALWCASCPSPAKNPGAGALVDAQLWYRDPMNTSNQTTSLSDAIEFSVCP